MVRRKRRTVTHDIDLLESASQFREIMACYPVVNSRMAELHAWRPNDVADITSPSVLEAIDWGALERLIYDPMEAQASCLSERRYQELVATFEQYRKAWKR